MLVDEAEANQVLEMPDLVGSFHGFKRKPHLFITAIEPQFKLPAETPDSGLARILKRMEIVKV